jgi:3,4-dihydroxy 2-butanone 4-phosphate synthase/GTP cyclohydrolase II
MQHLAIVYGDVAGASSNVPVRLHLEQVAEDVFGAHSRLDEVMARFAREGRGVIVYLREGSVGVAPSARRHPRSAPGVDDAHATASARQDEWREIGLGAQILRDLG